MKGVPFSKQRYGISPLKTGYLWLDRDRGWDLYTAISRKVVGKSARDNPERHCGWF